MRTVWKYPIVNEFGTVAPTITVPDNAKTLRFAVQGRELCVWLEVDPDAPMVDRHLVLVPTGSEIPDGATYLTTLDVAGPMGPLVFHIYEVTP